MAKNRFIIILPLLIAFILLQRYTTETFNGNELKKYQKYVPLDVRREIEKQRKINEIAKVKQFRVPILMYHYIEYVKDPENKVRAGLTITPYILDKQIETLKRANYTFLTNSDLADIIDEKGAMPQKPILLTFDDGYEDFYTDAFPILKKHNVKSTQYVIAGYLNHLNHLTTPQLIEIAKSAIVEIGAHTVDHDWLKGKSVEEVGYEATQGKERLEKLIGQDVVSFAYPYGAFDLQATQVIEASGYRSAVSTVPGIYQSSENRFFLYRLRPGIRIGGGLLNFLDQEKFKAF